MVKYYVSQPSIGQREQELVLLSLQDNRLTMGPAVARFEQKLGDLLNVREVVVCSSGTTALHLALAALDLGPGDEVLVPDLSFIATTNAVTYTGARPVLVDVSAFDWGIDPTDVIKKITPRTKAIVVVHLYGRPANIDVLKAIAKARNLYLIEDAAEGLGGYHGSQALGTFGLLGTFSFYGNKILTTGEGGAVVTNDSTLALRLRSLRGQGQHPTQRYWHVELGFNYRLTDLQASIGLAQLESFDSKLQLRAQVMATYRHHLGRYDCTGVEAAPWLFTFLLPDGVNRDTFMRRLLKEGIETRPTFIPMHEQPIYREPYNQYPNSSWIGTRGVSLPTYPELSLQAVDEIATIAKSVIAEERAAGEAA